MHGEKILMDFQSIYKKYQVVYTTNKLMKKSLIKYYSA